MTGTPSIHSIPESDGPAPPVRVVASSVSNRSPTLCSSMMSAATAPGSGAPRSTTVMRPSFPEVFARLP